MKDARGAGDEGAKEAAGGPRDGRRPQAEAARDRVAVRQKATEGERPHGGEQDRRGHGQDVEWRRIGEERAQAAAGAAVVIVARRLLGMRVVVVVVVVVVAAAVVEWVAAVRGGLTRARREVER